MSLLTLRDIIYSYPGGTSNVLNGINYHFEKGTFYAIVGSSGAGKSTLLGLLAQSRATRIIASTISRWYFRIIT